MKYKDRKHQRKVCEEVGSLLATMRTYCKEDLQEYITDAITILCETEVEENEPRESS